MRPVDELLYLNDLQLLGYIIGEVIEVVSLLEDNPDKVKLISSLNDFYAIHKTRTNDLLKLQRSISDARNKHRKVLAERDQYKADYQEVSKRLDQYMQAAMSKG